MKDVTCSTRPMSLNRLTDHQMGCALHLVRETTSMVKAWLGWHKTKNMAEVGVGHKTLFVMGKDVIISTG